METHNLVLFLFLPVKLITKSSVVVLEDVFCGFIGEYFKFKVIKWEICFHPCYLNCFRKSKALLYPGTLRFL